MLDKALEYGMPTKEAALTAHRILWLLTAKEALKGKLRSWLLGDG